MPGAHGARPAGARLDHDLRLQALAVIAGACLVQALPSLLPLAWFVPALGICLLRFPGRTLFAAMLLTAAWTTILAGQHMAARLPAAQDGTVHQVRGHVAGLPEAGAIRTRFVFAADTAPSRLRLSWYGEAPPLQPGDCRQLTVKLSAPHGSANAGSFDYEAWLWRKGVDATGYVKTGRSCAQAGRAAPVDTLRALAVQRIGSVLGEHPMRGIIEALTVGVKTRISDAQWDVFRRTGTTHLVAISGLHIGLVAGWILLLARWLLLRLPWQVPVLGVAALAALVGGWIYALLAGLGLPSLRAVLMLAAGLLALLHTRHISFGRVLALAAIIVVVWQPRAVLAPGFWLSFGAVAWIVYLVQTPARNKWLLFLRLQLGISIGLVPITLYFFNQASLVSPLVNALLIPMAGIYVPLLLLCMLALLIWPALGAPWLRLWADLLAGMWQPLEQVAHWPLAFMLQPAGLVMVVAAVAGIALLFAPRGLPGRWLGAVLVLPLLLGWQPPGQAIPPGGYRLHVLDVGQGLAVVVRTRNHVLVYDAGPKYRTGFDTGAAIVAPFLRHARIDHIDTLMISHADMDHIGGSQALLQQFPVRKHIGAQAPVPCRAGHSWQWDGVAFRVLHPQDVPDGTSTNNASCVVRITAAGGTTLLTGDIEAAAEQALVQSAGAELAADIIVVPHHGSDTSSTAVFVAAVAPAYALVSSGWKNRWDFPSAAVVARYRQQDARVLDTAFSGALTAEVVPGQALTVQRRRVRHARFWQLPQPDRAGRGPAG